MQAVRIASHAGGVVSQAAAAGDASAALPAEAMRCAGPVTIAGVREGILWLLDARGQVYTPHPIPLAAREKVVALNRDVRKAIVLWSLSAFYCVRNLLSNAWACSQPFVVALSHAGLRARSLAIAGAPTLARATAEQGGLCQSLCMELSAVSWASYMSLIYQPCHVETAWV